MPQNNEIVRNNRGQFAPAVRRPFPQDPKAKQLNPMEAEAKAMGMTLTAYQALCVKLAGKVEQQNPGMAGLANEVRGVFA